jgi:ATP-dependent phosphoenolpyruvate carboxykinase
MLYGFHLGHPGKVRGFLINTGGVGGDPETGRKDTAKKIIQINEMTEGVKSILRNTAEFTPEEYFGAHVLVSADGLDFSRWLPQNFYSAGEYAAWVGRRKESRRQYAERYKGLDREIAASIGI